MYIIVAKVSQNSTRANRVEAITGSSPRTILRMGSPRNGQRNMPWRQAASIRRVNTSDHASTTNAHTALITGRLTARGKTFPEKFSVELAGLKSGNLQFHVTGTVLRSRYGMDVGTPIYSNVVRFDMTLRGHK